VVFSGISAGAQTDDDAAGKMDVKGSGDITNLASNVLLLYRIPDEQMEKAKSAGKVIADLKLYIRKNREFGEQGVVKLMFNKESKTYSDGGE